MKIKVTLLMLSLFGSVFAEEAKRQELPKNPEVQKIDTRPVELTILWKKDTSTINRLTNFKRTPVQEGTQAYFQCLEASKRIQQVEAEAKSLKAKRATLAGASDDTLPATPSQTSGIGDKSQQYPTRDLNAELDLSGQRMKGFWQEFLQESIAKKSSPKKPEKDEPESSTQEERAAIAKKLLSRLDTRHYVHPLEKYSPTLSFLGAKLSLQGKNLNEINALFEKEDWLGLLSLVNQKALSEYPTIKTYDSNIPSIEGLTRDLAEMQFYLRLSPANPQKRILKVFDNQRYTIPTVIHPEVYKEWDSPLMGDANGGDFEVHPEGEAAGYLAEWNPSDGPVLLRLPLRPALFLPVAHILESTTERFTLKGNYFGEKEEFGTKNNTFYQTTGIKQADLNKMIEIGEISQDEANTKCLAKKLQMYKENLKYWTQW
jgi:hypothetical protein